MNAADRRASLGLLGAAVLGWVAVAFLLTTRSPVGDAGLQFFAAGLLGIAFTVTATPLFWLAKFARHRRIAYRGDWPLAVRRGAVVGLVVAVLVVLRVEDAFSVPLALFIVVMATIIEVGLSRQR
ncbi:MAG: hypothetical protein ACHQ15_02430 [Candidatus Limnocylindrales bacterium]